VAVAQLAPRARPALVGEHNEALERRVMAVETKPALDVEAADRAIAGIRRPELLVERLGDPVRYAQRVEAEVAGLSIETLLPYAADDHVGRFLAVWVPDELGHGAALQRLLASLGLPSFAPRPAETVPWHNRIAGWLGHRSRGVYEMVSMTYHTIGAINERLALGAYARMASIATDVGEVELADALFQPLRRDESAHLGYYRTYARQLRLRLSRYQLDAVRALITMTYAPVGAGMRRDKPPFGRALLALEDDPENPAVALASQDIACELLARPSGSVRPFVLNAMRECVGLAQRDRR
jgi:hypothetical protein